MRTVIAAALLTGALALALGCGSNNTANNLDGSWLATTNANGQATAPTSTSGQQPLSMTFDITQSPTISNNPGANTGYGVAGTSNTSGPSTSGSTNAAAANGSGTGNTVTVNNVNFVSGMDCFSGQGQAFAAIGQPTTFTPTAPMLNANGFVPASTGGGTNGAGGTTGTTTGTTSTTPNGTINAGSAGVPVTLEAWSGPGQTGNHLLIIALMNQSLNSGSGTFFIWAAPSASTATTPTAAATPAAGTCQDSSGSITLVRQSSGTSTNASATPSPTPTPTATATPTPTPTTTNAAH